MQVHRLHSNEVTPKPAHAPGLGGSSGLSDTERTTEATNGTPDSAAESPVTALLDRLQAIPPTREAVVERAREKVANGDYFTRPAAEMTAEVILHSV